MATTRAPSKENAAVELADALRQSLSLQVGVDDLRWFPFSIRNGVIKHGKLENPLYNWRLNGSIIMKYL